MKLVILAVVLIALVVGGNYGYKRWQHRYICIPPMPPHGSDKWMEDRTCGPADQLKYLEPITPNTGFDGVPKDLIFDNNVCYDNETQVDCKTGKPIEVYNGRKQP